MPHKIRGTNTNLGQHESSETKYAKYANNNNEYTDGNNYNVHKEIL